MLVELTYVRLSLKHIERSPLTMVLARGTQANSEALASSTSSKLVLDVHSLVGITEAQIFHCSSVHYIGPVYQ